jgi:hypothetical protein
MDRLKNFFVSALALAGLVVALAVALLVTSCIVSPVQVILGQTAYDVSVNLCSDVLFILLIALILWLLHRGELAEAQSFFGLSQQAGLKVYVSGHEDAKTQSKKVVTAMEYDAAIIIKDALRHLSGRGFIGKAASVAAGLIGQPPQLSDVTVEVSPLEPVTKPLLDTSVILIGGPVRNQLTAYYAQGRPFFRFGDGLWPNGFVERVDNQYRPVEGSHNVSIVERMKLDGQVVIFAFGYGEKHTKAAAEYLAANWRQLNKAYPNMAFGIRMSVNDQGRIKVERRLHD